MSWLRSPSVSCLEFRVGYDDRSRLRAQVAFKFRSSLYSRVSHLFFNEVVLKMVEAFLARAERIHGPPARRHSRKQVLHHGPVEWRRLDGELNIELNIIERGKKILASVKGRIRRDAQSAEKLLSLFSDSLFIDESTTIIVFTLFTSRVTYDR